MENFKNIYVDLGYKRWKIKEERFEYEIYIFVAAAFVVGKVLQREAKQ